MDERSRRRRFSKADRTALYVAAGGRCEECHVVLEPGWHADHVRPFSRLGPTHPDNGQALCPPCNQKKGSRMDGDKIKLRDAQAEVRDAVIARTEDGEKVTIAQLMTGYGKTLTWEATACEGMRRGLWDASATFAPRTSLVTQAELDWSGRRRKDGTKDKGWIDDFGDPRPNRFAGNTNSPPLTPAGVFGYVSTYQALAANPALHLAWADEHRGRFLMVLDEAHMLGTDDEETLRTAELIQQMAEYAAHVLILTATPYRSDQRELALCGEFYAKPDADGLRKLRPHVKRTYRQAVNKEILRPFQFNLSEGDIVLRGLNVTDPKKFQHIPIKEMEKHLKVALEDERIWRPIADAAIKQLRQERFDVDQRLQALVACTDQSHANNVFAYLKGQHPDLRIVKAVSDDTAAAKSALDAMRAGLADVLVSVRMAYMGFDCKTISVIGCLTHYRWSGHLSQLVGRGMRVMSDIPFEKQHVYVVGPEDPRLLTFCRQLRDDADQGLRDRDERKVDSGERGEKELMQVHEAQVTGESAYGIHADVLGDQLSMFRRLKDELKMSDSETQLAAFVDRLNGRTPTAASPFVDPAPVGTATMSRFDGMPIVEARKKCNNLVRSMFFRVIHLAGGADDHQTQQKIVAVLISRLNDRQGVPNTRHVATVEGLEERHRLAEEIADAYLRERGAA